ncbi:hypothetical protein [Xylanibacter rarus]|uniref:hypothetical protein n=1 Tax=Xylanibacter rarus TaxID=1676614 RepID=UPI003AB98E9A
MKEQRAIYLHFNITQISRQQPRQPEPHTQGANRAQRHEKGPGAESPALSSQEENSATLCLYYAKKISVHGIKPWRKPHDGRAAVYLPIHPNILSG